MKKEAKEDLIIQGGNVFTEKRDSEVKRETLNLNSITEALAFDLKSDYDDYDSEDEIN